MRYDLGSSGLFGRLAQSVERLVYTENVGGSSPSPPTAPRARGVSFISRLGLAASVLLSATATVVPGGGALAAEPMSFELLTIAGPAPCSRRRCANAGIKADVISAQGEITNDTAASFLSFVQAHGADPDFRPLVMLSSPGGTVVGAMKLGLVLRQIGATVLVARARGDEGSDDLHIVSSYCMSACVYAFFGGKRRIIPPASHLGIHQMAIYSHGFFGGDTTVSKGTPELVDALSAYTKLMGVSPAAIEEAEQIDSSSIHILTPKEIARWRVGTPRLH
jgi:hypothetical protein